MEVYIQNKEYQIKHINLISFDLNRVLRDETYLKSLIGNNILIGFAKNKSFIEVFFSEKTIRYDTRIKHDKTEIFVNDLDFLKLSKIMERFFSNRINELKQFKHSSGNNKDYRYLVLNSLIILFLVWSFSGCSSGSKKTSADPKMLLGISPLPYGETPWNDTSFQVTYQKAKEGGIDVVTWRHQWGELEPRLDEYTWNDIDYEISLNDQYGFGCSINFELIHTNVLGKFPSDLDFNKFDEEKYVNRFKKLLAELFKRHPGKIRYLWIGNEFNDYLANNTDLILPFRSFYLQIRDYIRSIDSNVFVGVAGAYHIARNNQRMDLLKEYAVNEDALGLTLYMQDDNANPGVADTESYYDNMLNAFPDVKIAIIETAWSSNGKSGNESNQVEYIRKLARVVEKHYNRFLFFSWFNLYDFPESLCNEIIDSYGLNPMDPNLQDFKQFLLSTALIANNQQEKPAWEAWERYIGSRF